MIYLTRRERFSAAHRLYNESYSDEKNLEVFGKCSNPNWHGHNYVLFVTIKGGIDPETGFLINIKTMKKIIQEEIVAKLDHKNINLDVDFMKGKQATTENLAVAIWQVLAPRFQELNAYLHKVRIEETENNFVEYFGD